MLFADTFRAFRHRDYFIFWCGLFLGHTATLIQTTAQSWLIFQLTDSTFYLGLEGFCLGLPRVLFSALGAKSSTVQIAKLSIPGAARAEGHKSLSRDMIDGFHLVAWNTPRFLSLLTVLGIVSFCTKP